MVWGFNAPSFLIWKIVLPPSSCLSGPVVLYESSLSNCQVLPRSGGHNLRKAGCANYQKKIVSTQHYLLRLFWRTEKLGWSISLQHERAGGPGGEDKIWAMVGTVVILNIHEFTLSSHHEKMKSKMCKKWGLVLYLCVWGFFFLSLFIYFRVGGVEGEEAGKNLKQTPHWVCSVMPGWVSWPWGHHLAETKSRSLDRLCHPGTYPSYLRFITKSSSW